jgi:hypothetical protein
MFRVERGDRGMLHEFDLLAVEGSGGEEVLPCFPDDAL